MLSPVWHFIPSGGYGEQSSSQWRGNYNLLRLRAFAKAKDPKGDPESKIFTCSCLSRSSICFEATDSWEPEANPGQQGCRPLLRLTRRIEETPNRGYLQLVPFSSFGGCYTSTAQFFWLELPGNLTFLWWLDAIKPAGLQDRTRVMMIISCCAYLYSYLCTNSLSFQRSSKAQ